MNRRAGVFSTRSHRSHLNGFPTLHAGITTMIGDPGLLTRPLLGLFSSVRVPPDLILPTLDLARDLARSGTSVIGGFQTPLEKLCLKILLSHACVSIVCLSRHLSGVNLPGDWARGLDQGRLAVISSTTERRATAATGVARNSLVVDLATELFVVHAPGGSRAYFAAAQALDRGKTVSCFAHARNADLEILGAQPINTGDTKQPIARTVDSPARANPHDHPLVEHCTLTGCAARQAIDSDMPLTLPPHALS